MILKSKKTSIPKDTIISFHQSFLKQKIRFEYSNRISFLSGRQGIRTPDPLGVNQVL